MSMKEMGDDHDKWSKIKKNKYKKKVYFLETFLGIWFDKIIQTNGNFCVWFSDFKV